MASPIGWSLHRRDHECPTGSRRATSKRSSMRLPRLRRCWLPEGCMPRWCTTCRILPSRMLARPYLPLAGIRVDPVLAGRQRARPLTGLSVLTVADGTQRPLSLPDGARPSVPTWAPDGAQVRVHRGRARRHRRVGGRRRVGDRPAGSGAAGPRLARRRSAHGGRDCAVDPRRHVLLALGALAPAPDLPAAVIEPRGRRRRASSRRWRRSRICSPPQRTRTSSRRWPPPSRCG